MSYRFKASDASMTDGLRRIAADEFAMIAAARTDRALAPERKVHEARKATKRLRALVRLAGPVFPEAQQEIAALRDAAGLLSALRDRGALVEALDTLTLPDAPAAGLRAALDTDRAVSRTEIKRLLSEFNTRIGTIETRALAWTLTEDGWGALSPGLERSYRRLVRAQAGARQTKAEDDVHDWRKRAKDHWYHTLLLRGAFPPVMDGYAKAAEQVCNDLGDWRDLGLLEQAAAKVPAHLLSKADAEAAGDVITRSRRRALRRALRTARRLTSETPDAYTARLMAWWKLSH
jgi:CHAD domain-containing protein